MFYVQKHKNTGSDLSTQASELAHPGCTRTPERELVFSQLCFHSQNQQVPIRQAICIFACVRA